MKLMKTKQTAVEWLEEELAKNLKYIVENKDYNLIEALIESSKKMEQLQIECAFISGELNQVRFFSKKQSYQYYKETYGNEANS